jgi:hypothetical protein
MLDRSTGTPRTLVAPGVTSELSIARWTKSACSRAGIRVVSAFQNRMSKANDLQLSRRGEVVTATVEDTAPYGKDTQYLLSFTVDGPPPYPSARAGSEPQPKPDRHNWINSSGPEASSSAATAPGPGHVSRRRNWTREGTKPWQDRRSRGTAAGGGPADARTALAGCPDDARLYEA